MAIFKRKEAPLTAQAVQKRKLKFKIGLSLAGGGARGFTHVGALRAFDEENIVFDYVSGTSAGSIVGALYCAGYSYKQMLAFGKTFSDRQIRTSSSIFFPSPSKNIEHLVRSMIGDITFDKLLTPFCCVAVDLSTGEEEVFSQGDVSSAVACSCCAPVVFQPFKRGEHFYIDGGLSNNLPSDTLRRMGAEIVVGVDINSTRGEGTNSTKLIDVMLATWRIAMKSTVYKGYQNSDIVITPDVKRFKSTTVNQDIEEMAEEGYKAAKEKMPQIKELLGIK